MADETPKTPEAPAAPAAKAPKRPPDAKENFRYIIRLANTDLEGARTVVYALTNIKGLGIRMAEVVTDLAGIPRSERIGNLTDEQVAKIQEVLTNLGEEPVRRTRLGRAQLRDGADDLTRRRVIDWDRRA